MSAPPAVGGRQLKFKHVHFGGTCPTTLIIHSNQDKKFLIIIKISRNSFRSKLGLIKHSVKIDI